MRARRSSPARSETEVDIGQSLFTKNGRGASASDSEGEDEVTNSAATPNDGLDFMATDTDVDDDEDVIAKQLAASQRKATNLKGKSVKKGGGFQAMGLNANLLKAITRKGFSVPTPIQRKTIPLLLNDKDVVGMARTGSGKTAAFVIPMIEKLKAHSPKVGARALIMSPSRELALQTLSVVKELGKGTDLRSVLLVGGDSLEEQFSAMASNPDIVIATPGRFLHLKVEMNLDLQSIRYVVFDEADRLFEMGFAAQLTEILYALPSSRQTLLFSATLPKSLVEFARAGLQEPSLIRLDADSKVSPDLQSAFFTVKSSEKEGALLHLLQDVIGVPTGSQLLSTDGEQKGSKKRKRSENESSSKGVSNQHSTIVFAATKHHVEYLANLLKAAGYAVSYVYGSLDQTARKEQVQAFRSHQSNILVVTDVAARGIDIPILANVINYDFPSQPKIYVHRVGRTARAGQKGWSYSFVRDADAPYLLDLQLFLGRKLIVGRSAGSNFDLATDVVVGSQRRDAMQAQTEWASNTLASDVDLAALRTVASKGEKLYQRTRNSASSESAKRAKQLVGSDSWTELHPMFDNDNDGLEAARQAMLARVGGFRPQESIFEIGARRGGRKNNEEAVDAIRTIRHTLKVKKRKSQAAKEFESQTATNENTHDDPSEGDAELDLTGPDILSEASDSELEVTFSTGNKKSNPDTHSNNTFKSSEYFMSYAPEGNDLDEERAYGVHSGSNTNFVEAARGATMDLAGDEGAKNFGEARSVMRWDKRHKKYVSRNNDEDGSKGSKLVRGESGAKIAASFRSGRFDAWKKANKIGRALRVGEKEREGVGSVQSGSRMGNKRFKHSKLDAPKAADKFRDDYETRKKKVAAAKEREQANTGNKRELHSVDDIRKARNLKQKRQEKNARPQRKGKR
ncbi:ATP-dependent RNA helicase dbp10 [Cyphellophora attinorum]|uniref:ATP-dependent RNA helicase DBP10 n=1 Tax=Cyphellophora attinorum TaxID=1664694 RepID=A0A0N1H730_9EURO|nr:ATP-dependent RNA helicase dbp10 [Phialophora attinorum]KPI38320.1 ATP-dependent RNA helicase dbp10 [Phialophora attinorum]